MSRNGNTKTVAVAMSGGVDSSVAAALLSQQGYRVIGLTMRLWDVSEDNAALGVVRGCCSMESVSQAQRVCDTLKIPHYVVDMRHEFRQLVVDDFVSDYMEGRTPNPCIRCNTFIKWQSLWNKARGLGADYLATGHYAKIVSDENGWHLYRADFRAKDQSYALWGIPRNQLSTTLFPLGDKKKPEVRQIARDLGLGNAETPESQDICFVPSSGYQDLLKERIPDRLKQGKVKNTSGKIIGQHDGFQLFTIGQRRGLKIALGKPAYVTKIIPKTNTVILGDRSDVLSTTFLANEVNWTQPLSREKKNTTINQKTLDIAGHKNIIMRNKGWVDAEVKIRYLHKQAKAKIKILPNNKVEVKFRQPQFAITPGQAAVFYKGDNVLGGAWIKEVIK